MTAPNCIIFWAGIAMQFGRGPEKELEIMPGIKWFSYLQGNYKAKKWPSIRPHKWPLISVYLLHAAWAIVSRKFSNCIVHLPNCIVPLPNCIVPLSNCIGFSADISRNFSRDYSTQINLTPFLRDLKTCRESGGKAAVTHFFPISKILIQFRKAL